MAQTQMQETQTPPISQWKQYQKNPWLSLVYHRECANTNIISSTGFSNWIDLACTVSHKPINKGGGSDCTFAYLFIGEYLEYI